MSLANTVVKGAAWTVAIGMAARALGLVGTLVVTRYLAPDVMGDVEVAAVLVLTAHQFSVLGLGHYLVAKPNEGPEVGFHTTVFTLLTGSASIGLLLIFGSWFVGDSRTALPYLPGLALAVFIDRLAFVPTRVLVRDMRFRTGGIVRALGEVVFAAVAVGMAVAGQGGESIVVANLARSAVRAGICIAIVDYRDWLKPHPLTMARTRDMFRFGFPVGLSVMATFAARYWDNLLIAGMFGTQELGFYKLAYNLSDVPSNQVGEQIGDVLLPSFARLPPDRRQAALARSLRLLALIMFPLSIGLGVIAPTVVRALLAPQWEPVAPRLAILACLSAVFPIGYAVYAYLNAANHPRAVMALAFFRTVILLGSMGVLGSAGGPLGACFGVGIAFGLYALVSVVLTSRLEGWSPAGPLLALLPPLFACVPMAAVVLGVRALLPAETPTVVALIVELIAGAGGYIGAALVMAKSVSRELIDLVRGALAHRRRRADTPA